MPIQLINRGSGNQISFSNRGQSGNTSLFANAQVSNLVTTGLVLSLDAGSLASYPGSGSTWTDTVQSRAFTLYSSPAYSSNNGGYLTFVPASFQYAASSTSLTSSLNTWTVEVWHYYTGTNTGTNPCIVTELYPGSTSRINFSLGTNLSGNLQNGFFNGVGSGWQTTPSYTLTANNWYHIVGTYDKSTISLYVNNSLVQSTSNTNAPQSSQGGIRLMRRWDLTDYWGGRLAIVNLYTGSFTAGQVSQNWDANRSRFGL